MDNSNTGRRMFAIMMWWFVACVIGLTVMLLAVGWLGLWVAVGAVAGFGTTLVTGVLCQFLFVTDFDAMLEAKTAAADEPGAVS